MNQIIFPQSQGNELRKSLLSSELESAAIVLARPVELKNGEWRLLALETHIPDSWSYSSRESDFIELRPDFLVPLIKKARVAQLSIILVHTHPWDGHVQPSRVDRSGERLLFPTFFRRVPGVPHGRLIIGKQDYSAALFTDNCDNESALEVLNVGESIVSLERKSSDSDQDAIFERQIRAFGDDGQRALRAMRVGIVGVGGTGSVVAQQLAYLGVNQFTLVDDDTIENTNLNRVIGASLADVGAPKVGVVSANIKGIRPKSKVTLINDTIYKRDVVRKLLGLDVLFCCTDSHGSRAILSQLAYQYFMPVIDMGVRINAKEGKVSHITGRIQMLSPGLPCLICSELLDSEQVRRDLLSDAERQVDRYILGTQERQPAVVSINSTVASLAVSMLLSAVTGIPLRGRYLLYRGEVGTVKVVSAEQNANCVICSKEGVFGRGDSTRLPGWD